MTDRGRLGNLKARAARWEDVDFTKGHHSYRTHLENLRMLLVGIEFVIAQDTGEGARWLRQHSLPYHDGKRPASCPKLGWLTAFIQGVRYRFKGKLASELVVEAAKDAVLMAQVHAEYLLMESGGGMPSDRYRRDADK